MAVNQKAEFKPPYIGIDSSNGIATLYGNNGDFSVIIKITNPAIHFNADLKPYNSFHHIFLNIIKILGEGYFIQKQDVFSKRRYSAKQSEHFLQQKYNDHFQGREYNEIDTYVIITKQVNRRSFFVYDKRALINFYQHISKIMDLFQSSEFDPNLLSEVQIQEYIKRTICMDFKSDSIVLDNFKVGNDKISLGSKSLRCISLVDTDIIDLPDKLGTYHEKSDGKALRKFPMDNFAFLHSVPDYSTIVYNQVIEIPNQHQVINKLELKRKRHIGVPDPTNLICVEDIDKLLVDVARDNQMVVNAHFNIVVCADTLNLDKACNFIESGLFNQGIIPSRNAYNQMELYQSILAGNSVALKKYDWFLTTSDAALCFFFKESLQTDEDSDFLIRFTDRAGVPRSIDPSDLSLASGRISNRNCFICGPSGSGKSMALNSILEQYLLYNMDVVIVDVGHSYSGLCSYYKGKYITYTQEKPITMNPFLISEGENNVEKKDFLCTLICLLWKGADGNVSTVERDMISDLISAYYTQYFSDKGFMGLTKKETKQIERDVREILKLSVIQNGEDLLINELTLCEDNSFTQVDDSEEESIDQFLNAKSGKANVYNDIFSEKYNSEIEIAIQFAKSEYDLEHIPELNFNSFYEFALRKIPQMKIEQEVPFDLNEFRFVLKKFYIGGEYQSILNEAADQSLLSEPLIIYEIDNLQNNKTLYPIVTLIIMDLFLQKMRLRDGQRKILVLEECWKAIASPLMANFLLYLNKTVRKFWGGVIEVTQSLSDVLGNPILKDCIISESDTIILLDQTKFIDNYEEIAKLLSISETEQKKIFTINNLDNKEGRGRFKEVYIRRGAVGEVYGIELSIYQYLVFTTEKPEKNAVETYVNSSSDYQEGLERFVEDLNKSGLSLGAFVKKVNKDGIQSLIQLT